MTITTHNVPETRLLSGEADPSTAPEEAAAGASLYERLGGLYGISGAVDVLVDRLFKNVKVNANPAVHEHHGNPANAAGYKTLVASWSMEAAGGPTCYPGRDMVEAHKDLAIDTEGFNAVYFEIEATLHYLGVPAGETAEFMTIIESYRSQVVTA